MGSLLLLQLLLVNIERKELVTPCHKCNSFFVQVIDSHSKILFDILDLDQGPVVLTPVHSCPGDVSHGEGYIRFEVFGWYIAIEFFE